MSVTNFSWAPKTSRQKIVQASFLKPAAASRAKRALSKTSVAEKTEKILLFSEIPSKFG